MTVDDFYADLMRTPRKWYKVQDRIRCVADCPITAVARLYGYHLRTTYWEDAAFALGISRLSARTIAMAADGWTNTRAQRRHRKRILEATGLAAVKTSDTLPHLDAL